MSPRKAAALRGQGDENIREHLVATAARLIDERGTAALSVRDIAREARVADGVLYNYFADKEDLLARALLAHVASVMASAPQLLPPAGVGTVAGNLRVFFEQGVAVLSRVTPAFASLLSQPKVLTRFHGMVGGDAAFSAAPAGPDDRRDSGPDGEAGGRGFGEMLTRYLQAEQELGRVDDAADCDAVAMLVVGAIHGQVLPRVLFNPPGTTVSMPPGLAERLARAVIAGIAPP
jgi:AcrR family transcriptional regulator